MIQQKETVYIACAWRCDGQYAADQAQRCKTFQSQKLAQRLADKLNADPLMLGAHPHGYVVRAVNADSVSAGPLYSAS